MRRGLRKRDRQVNLQIWCSEETKRMFKLFVVENGFRNYEEALLFLLKKAREYSWSVHSGRIY